MKDYFSLHLNQTQLAAMSSLSLAHVGDGVYELLVRGWLCAGGLQVNENLHRRTVALVRASAQAEAIVRITPHLTAEELAVVHRGRNAHVHTIPKAASRGEYLRATALEALFGWLYLQDRKARINQLFALIMEPEEG